MAPPIVINNHSLFFLQTDSSFLFQEETTEEEEKTLDFDDFEMHEDDDFLKTLDTLDEGRPPKKVLSYSWNWFDKGTVNLLTLGANPEL